jgi:hypothetical protein
VQQQQAEEAPASRKAPPPAAKAGGASVPTQVYKQSKEFEQYQCNAQELKDFVDQHGRYPTRTTSADIAEIKLAWWYQEQKKQHNNGVLLLEKEQCLNDVMGSTEWQENIKVREFMDMVKRVEEWVAEHDGQLPPASAVGEDGANVGMWVHNRRREYKQGKLEPERVKALESIPGWQNARRKVSFEEGLEILKVCVGRHGKIPSNNTKGDHEGFNVGRWTKLQRENMRAGKLSVERVKALEQVDGWYWERTGQ